MRCKVFVVSLALIVVANAGRRYSAAAAFSSSSTSVRRLTLDEYLASPPSQYHQTPVIIRDIASRETIESLADTLMTVLGQEEVSMQRKKRNKKSSKRRTTSMYNIKLEDCIDYMMDSNIDDAYFAFCEGLLLPDSNDSTNELSNMLREIREAPFVEQENWFDYFPSNIRPSDAIILAGSGATSTLHRDPFEWTGTSICLEGIKIWRFIVPPSLENGDVSIVDGAFSSYRLDSIAWEQDSGNNEEREPIAWSAGWQSDMSLFDSVDKNFPSGFKWSTKLDHDEVGCRRELELAGMDMSTLRPCNDALNAFDVIAKSTAGSSLQPSFITAIQQQGDLLLIPAHCWHQTYAPVPSIALASQRCGSMIDSVNVVRHILNMVNRSSDEKTRRGQVPDILKRICHNEGTGQEVVKSLVEYVNR
jgi:hypothetical protein